MFTLCAVILVYATAAFGCNVEHFKNKAICHVRPNVGGVVPQISGFVMFSQREPCFEPTLVHIHAEISGLPPTGDHSMTKHGFHVHELNDLSNGCQSLGGHYNPLKTDHGSPLDHPFARHMGDLGNVVADTTGHVLMDWYAPATLKLEGEHSIVNRSIVLHELPDDLGRGGDAGSRSAGNAGRRLACCVIQRI